MPRGKRNPEPATDHRPWLVADARPGTQFLTAAGIFVNGTPAPVAVLKALKAMGFHAEAVTAVPVESESEQELKDIEAANRILGVEQLPDGRTRTQAEIDKGMRSMLAPLRKSSYF